MPSMPVAAPTKPLPNSSYTPLIKMKRGEGIEDNLALHF
jgi:hypothetical protein